MPHIKCSYAGCRPHFTLHACLQDAAQHAGNWPVEVHCLLLRLHKQLLGPPEAPTSDEQHAGTIGAAVTVPAAVLEGTELQHEVANIAQALGSLQAVASRLQARGHGAHRCACSRDHVCQVSAALTCPVCFLLQLSSTTRSAQIKITSQLRAFALLALKQRPFWYRRGGAGAAHEDPQAPAQTPQMVQMHGSTPESETADVQPAADTMSLELQQLLAAVQWQLLRHVEELYWAVVKQPLGGQALNKKV